MKYMQTIGIVFLVTLTSGSDPSIAEDEGFCSSEDSCDRPTVLCNLVMGRLGNHLWNYMMGVGVNVTYGITYAVSRETKAGFIFEQCTFEPTTYFGNRNPFSLINPQHA